MSYAQHGHNALNTFIRQQEHSVRYKKRLQYLCLDRVLPTVLPRVQYFP